MEKQKNKSCCCIFCILVQCKNLLLKSHASAKPHYIAFFSFFILSCVSTFYLLMPLRQPKQAVTSDDIPMTLQYAHRIYQYTGLLPRRLNRYKTNQVQSVGQSIPHQVLLYVTLSHETTNLNYNSALIPHHKSAYVP